MNSIQESAHKPESTFSTLWLALALTLTMAPQLRVSVRFPIGPGEILCALWITWTVWDHFVTHRRGLNRSAAAVAILALLVMALIFAGILSAIYLNLWNNSGWRDFFAITFALALLFAFSLRFDCLRSIERFCLTLMAMLALYVFPLFLLSRFITHIGPLQLFYDITLTRFAALAHRPGQIDYFFVAIPFLCLHFLGRSKGALSRSLLIMLCLAAVTLGIDNKSDAFMIGLLAGALVFAVVLWVKLIGWLRRASRPAAMVAVSLTLILLIGGIALYHGKVDAWARYLYEKENSQGNVRVRLAMNALEAGSHSPIVGLGPGAYSGITEPFLIKEAHNIFADIAASGGILGVLVFVSFVAWTGWRCWRTRFAWLNGAFAALLAYSMFHYTLRQPLYLLGLLMISRLAVTLYEESSAVRGGLKPRTAETFEGTQ